VGKLKLFAKARADVKGVHRENAGHLKEIGADLRPEIDDISTPQVVSGHPPAVNKHPIGTGLAVAIAVDQAIGKPCPVGLGGHPHQVSVATRDKPIDDLDGVGGIPSKRIDTLPQDVAAGPDRMADGQGELRMGYRLLRDSIEQICWQIKAVARSKRIPPTNRRGGGKEIVVAM
jgi:hypothetical protein